MRKQIIAAVAGIAAIASLAAVALLPLSKAPDQPPAVTTVATAPPSAPPAPIVAAPAELPVAAMPESDEEELEAGKVTQTLKGADFTLEVSVNGNDRYRDLAINMDDGESVDEMQAVGGEPGELSSRTFDMNDNFKLQKIIPGEPREQIVMKGDQFLMQGQGSFQSHTIYRIDGKRLVELFSVVTGREREADFDGNGGAALDFAATVEHTTRDDKPAILYRVKAGHKPERVITFLWDGKQFKDASGAYKELIAPYMP